MNTQANTIMKSANPLLVETINMSLDKQPIDSEAILLTFSDESRFGVSIILEAFVNLDKFTKENMLVLEEHKKFLAEYEQRLKLYDVQFKHDKERIRDLTKTVDNRINQTTLAQFFLSHPDLVEGYKLTLDNKVCYQGIVLSAESNQLLYLSLELENYFGSRNIPLAVVINGLKRYLVTIEKQEVYYRDFLLTVAYEFLSNSKTRKRNKISLKYLRDNMTDYPEVTANMIKATMVDAGYIEGKEKNYSVYFTQNI